MWNNQYTAVDLDTCKVISGHLGTFEACCGWEVNRWCNLQTNKSEDITPVLKSLHWLPVSFRIEFKVLVLCYNSLNGCSPAYMCSMLNYRDPPTDRCTLRNDELDLLREPSARLKSHGDRAFSIYAPKLWNTLPLHVRKASTPDSFKKMLKTLLFKRSFDHC